MTVMPNDKDQTTGALADPGDRAERGDATAPVPPGPARFSGRRLRELVADDVWLDELIDRADEGGVALTGPGGFLPEMIKAVLERGLAAELTSHVGYEVGDPAGRGSPNSRKRLDAQDGADRGRRGAAERPA